MFKFIFNAGLNHNNVPFISSHLNFENRRANLSLALKNIYCSRNDLVIVIKPIGRNQIFDSGTQHALNHWICERRNMLPVTNVLSQFEHRFVNGTLQVSFFNTTVKEKFLDEISYIKFRCKPLVIEALDG